MFYFSVLYNWIRFSGLVLFIFRDDGIKRREILICFRDIFGKKSSFILRADNNLVALIVLSYRLAYVFDVFRQFFYLLSRYFTSHCSITLIFLFLFLTFLAVFKLHLIKYPKIVIVQ